jgi:hypothetical protein
MKSPLYRIALILLVALPLTSCSSLQQLDLNGIVSGQMPLSQDTVAAGLREALRVGTERTSSSLSSEGGFSSNSLLRIALPDEMTTLASRLRSLGLGDQVDSFETQMNRAAERAAGEAVDVFSGAIRTMTIQDAFAILDGPPNAATQYFQERTTVELTSRFEPVVQSAMDQVGVYTVYSRLVERYNSIPLVRPVQVDLEDYIVQKTLAGMFSVLETEELRIREDPLARTTDLLKRVFGNRDRS